MQRSDYLNPENMRSQCAKAIQCMEEDCKALEIVRKSIRFFAEDPEIESEAFDALVRQLEDYETVMEAMRIANLTDSGDFHSLSGLVGNEVLDGETIFCQMENAWNMKENYESKEFMYRNSMAATQDAILYTYYRWKAGQYGRLALNSHRLYKRWEEKTERFDEIAASTNHLFLATDEIGTWIQKGLSKIRGAFQNGVYEPDKDDEWRRQLINEGIHLAMGYRDRGGDQNGPHEIWQRGEAADREWIRELVHSYEEYGDYSDEEIEELLKKLNSEGCGYVAFANVLADEFRRKEAEFEKIFGFPLFQEDRNGITYVNYNPLILDLYCASDNHNRVWNMWQKHDIYDANEDPSADVGRGTTQDDRIYRFERYMNGRGVVIKIKNIRCSTEEVFHKCKEEAKRGNRVIISTCPVRLEGEDGELSQMDGGHAMTVIGLTDDGRVEVSSWGEIYYITPTDPDYQEPEKNHARDAYVKIQSVSFESVK
ncbi:MAG: hypothetical protein HFG82_05180 [Dorea sp.]|jgi:hypothetical protein|nr:hypothetical protein [Dorea sp.]GFI42884.1 hypothetical protein IMSAGC018_00548 [Lachnospiraceae bacterium]